MPLLILRAVAPAMILGACATTGPADENTVGRSIQQPLRDLNVVRDRPVEVLVAARTDPYRLPAEPACETLAAELTLLDAALGPDLDDVRAAERDNLAESLTSDAIGDLIGLPYRGVVRRVTGADRREREVRARKLAGSIRRGFLKGWAAKAGCPAGPAP